MIGQLASSDGWFTSHWCSVSLMFIKLQSLLAVISLISFCATGEDVHTYKKIMGSVGESYILKSRMFPGPYAFGERISEQWHISAKDTHTYIQVIFTDFDINSHSIVKIVDGKEMTSKTTSHIYSQNVRPMYYSLSNHLVILLKSEETNINGIPYYGIRANISFVAFSRYSLNAQVLPSTGYCGSMIVNPKSKHLIFKPENNHTYRYDCIWYISARYLRVVLANFTASRPIQFSIHTKPVSDTNRLNWTPKGKVSSSKVLQSAESRFYIRLIEKMAAGNGIHIEFSNYSADLVNAPTRLKTVKKMCPYRMDTYRNTCVNYWDVVWSQGRGTWKCHEYGSYQEIECSKGSPNCYLETFDKCDSFTDCPGKEDEDDCTDKGSGFWGTPLVVAGLTFLVILICVYLRKHNQMLRSQVNRSNARAAVAAHTAMDVGVIAYTHTSAGIRDDTDTSADAPRYSELGTSTGNPAAIVANDPQDHVSPPPSYEEAVSLGHHYPPIREPPPHYEYVV